MATEHRLAIPFETRADGQFPESRASALLQFKQT